MTLREMRRLVNESLVTPRVRATALQITSSCGRNRVCQAIALRAWMDRNFRFIPDPVGVELVHRPERLLDELDVQGYIVGDCDDAAVLGAALGKAVGFPARFVVLGFFTPRAPFAHVYTELLGDTGWFELDVTKSENRPLPTRVKVVRV